MFSPICMWRLFKVEPVETEWEGGPSHHFVFKPDWRQRQHSAEDPENLADHSRDTSCLMLSIKITSTTVCCASVPRISMQVHVQLLFCPGYDFATTWFRPWCSAALGPNEQRWQRLYSQARPVPSGRENNICKAWSWPLLIYSAPLVWGRGTVPPAPRLSPCLSPPSVFSLGCCAAVALYHRHKRPLPNWFVSKSIASARPLLCLSPAPAARNGLCMFLHTPQKCSWEDLENLVLVVFFFFFCNGKKEKGQSRCLCTV